MTPPRKTLPTPPSSTGSLCRPAAPWRQPGTSPASSTATSNFVFHEVRTAKDKRDVVKEALRVLKKGGVFSFQDMFSQKALYGDMEEFVRILKEEGISEVHYIGNLEKKLDFIPGFVTTPWMISGMGIIYGKK